MVFVIGNWLINVGGLFYESIRQSGQKAQGFLLLRDHYLFWFLRSLGGYTMSRLSENWVPCSLQRLLSETGARHHSDAAALQGCIERVFSTSSFLPTEKKCIRIICEVKLVDLMTNL